MAKRKKYPRLPNGFGSIRYLGKGRRNPYAVHPPTRLDASTGDITDRPAALCYVDDYMVGIAVLTAWHAGNYKPGYELSIKQEVAQNTDAAAISNRLLSDYRKISGIDMAKPTFSQVYDRFFANKFPEGHKYSDATVRSTTAAYKNCKELHPLVFCSLKHSDLQSVVDRCPLKHASLELIINLFHQMYQYALMNDLCEKDYSTGVKIKKEDDDEKGIPFTTEELAKIYAAREDETAEMLVIMCLSGFRINEYRNIYLNTDEWYFQGGSKTDAGKSRIVPVHSFIQPLVMQRMERYGNLLPITAGTFRKNMNTLLKQIGITERHTPHDCRHTFSYLCEKYEVAENDRKRMLGHAFSDITNRVYGHRDVEELRKQIEKINCDFLVTIKLE